MHRPVDSPVSNPALEITSSAYVDHSAEMIFEILDEQKEELFKLKDKYGAVVTPYQLEENDK